MKGRLLAPRLTPTLALFLVKGRQPGRGNIYQQSNSSYQNYPKQAKLHIKKESNKLKIQYENIY